jgi:hypothetical protein
MAKKERLYSAEQAAYATRLAVSSLRSKVSRLGIKGNRQGTKVFYTHRQLEDIYNGVPAAAHPGRKLVPKRKRA